MKHKILMGLTIIAMSSCMKLKKKDDVLAQPPVPAPAETTEVQIEKKFVNQRTELHYIYKINEGSNLHQVTFQAPASWPREVMIKKAVLEAKSEAGINLNSRDEWSDFLVSNEKVNYQFYSLENGQMHLLDEVEVLPVLDLKLGEDLNLAQKYKLNSKTKLIYFRTLVMGSQSHLFIEDFSGHIYIEKLTANTGFIQTFPLDSRASDGVTGKSGGNVTVEIQSGFGDLSLVMKVQNCGHGAAAKAPDFDRKGQSGLPADGGFFRMYVPNIAIGEFSNGIVYDCEKAPNIISNGTSGHSGYPGNNGMNGGNSGKVNIQNNSADLNIELVSVPGHRGGRSAGGEGGEGGDPAVQSDGGQLDLVNFLMKKKDCTINPVTQKCGDSYRIRTSCVPQGLSKKGEQGSQGLAGISDGEDGVNQPSCLYEQNQKIKCINE